MGLLECAKQIKEYCGTQLGCKKCLFRNANDSCRINSEPEIWELPSNDIDRFPKFETSCTIDTIPNTPNTVINIENVYLTTDRSAKDERD